MQNTHIQWARDTLENFDYRTQEVPAIIQDTPWSKVHRFITDKGYVYLKQVPPALFIEPSVIELLQGNFQEHIPSIIAINHDQHCFLMDDRGIQLHEYFKKKRFSTEILVRVLHEYTAIQIFSMRNIEDYLSLGVPDWRLEKLPGLYNDLIEREDLLLGDGLSRDEVSQLSHLQSKFLKICDRLSQFHIANAFGHADFHPKNILIDQATLKTTIIDLGEVVITHPFFSLNNCLHMAMENFSLSDLQYDQLLDSCLQPWLSLESRENLREILNLIQQTWSIHAVLGEVRLMDSVNKEDFKKLHREGRLSNKLRFWLKPK